MKAVKTKSDLKSGDEVVVWRDNGEALITEVCFINNDSGLVWVKGISGCYDISSVRKPKYHNREDNHD